MKRFWWSWASMTAYFPDRAYLCSFYWSCRYPGCFASSFSYSLLLPLSCLTFFRYLSRIWDPQNCPSQIAGGSHPISEAQRRCSKTRRRPAPALRPRDSRKQLSLVCCQLQSVEDHLRSEFRRSGLRSSSTATDYQQPVRSPFLKFRFVESY